LGQFHFTPERYLELMHAEVPDYERIQDEVAAATEGVAARAVLELGVGTGETSRRVLDRHPGARLIGIDDSEEMLAAAGAALCDRDVDLRASRLQEPLPPGPFDLAVSAFAVHHLDARGKADLFARVAAALVPGGRFVLADVVVPADPADAVTPLDAGFDLPDSVPDQLQWLAEAGFDARATWTKRDVAVLVADRRPASNA
jgi:tRNA (cmo5U34)-methyltransferase